MRGSGLHLVVPGCEQRPRAALVQHGGMRQPSEGSGASRAGSAWSLSLVVEAAGQTTSSRPVLHAAACRRRRAASRKSASDDLLGADGVVEKRLDTSV
jgi:hypothetical protein